MSRYLRHGADPFLALVLEVGGGFFGFLGLGWIYAGRVPLGLILLVGYWLLAGAISVLLIIFSSGIWCCFLPAQNLIFGCLSGYLVYQSMRKGL